ncbi:Cation/H+ exchanger [Kalmanozyma brasiliensis GHG001]|uniref:Cation/H+ exchanger transmembrane domain-containing protein n=1 Tax=Kalmanozyma brasiliensis (strain GHG001) TaxID=1365824 RepID=V5EFK5_KALBG|nr:Cation/H+ exchanger [Kalmanozyma brasiliensis GHG001]EST09281.1 Cation/H+ exchanger [Kalmanozyma brasiliensis GHG001]
MPFNYGFLSHSDPLTFDPNNYVLTTNGFGLFLTQVIIIIVLCQLLGKLFKLIGQPAVVGELLAGILLGPTALGNIPGFTETIVPTQALGLLKLMANIGLSLFLFLIGLETDTDLMAKYWQKVVLITLPGMAIPFGIAVGISRLIWMIETDQTVKFTTFFLFVGTVMAVTSLSVLSRIMAEMNILSTRLGCITIAAGVCNDLIGYVLLALGSALGTGGKQIDALYQLLAAAGYIVLLWFIFRPVMNRLIVRSGFDMATGAEDRVPEHLLVIALCGALISAFYTDAMGVHPIVGAFSFGVCCPHGNFAVKVTESIETLVMLVLLPLYFVTSGLSTNFKLLDDGTCWGLICLLIVGIFVSKFGATAASAKLAGMTWRESMCVASLMQSKGIIEIIILNVALQLEVVSPKVFAMLVICFLCTTMSVRPLSRYVYFSSLAQKGAASKSNEGDEKHGHGANEEIQDSKLRDDADSADFPITVAIASPSPATKTLMFLLNLIGPDSDGHSPNANSSGHEAGQIAVDLLRLLPTEYTTSSIMQLINVSDERQRDEMMESLKKVQQLCRVPTSAVLAREKKLSHSSATATAPGANGVSFEVPPDTFVVPRDEMIKMIGQQNAKAQHRLGTSDPTLSELGRGLALVTWEAHHSYGRGLSWLGMAAAASGLSFSKALNEEDASVSFWQANSDAQSLPSRLFRDLRKQCATGVLLDPSMSQQSGSSVIVSLDHGAKAALRRELEGRHDLRRPSGMRRILIPFFGGADDRAAVELLRKVVLNSPGSIQGLVITFTNADEAETSNAIASQVKAQAPMTPLQHLTVDDDEHIQSINLQTVHQKEAARVDARFLFHQQDASNAATTVPPISEDLVATIDTQGQSESEDSSSPATEDERLAKPLAQRTSTTRTEAGIIFLTLPSSPETATAPISTMSKVLLPLLDEQQDMLFIGRGKWNQRPKEFRQEVERMHAEQLASSSPIPEELREEHRAIGNCLGAVTEGLLLQSLRSCAIVVQAAQQ